MPKSAFTVSGFSLQTNIMENSYIETKAFVSNPKKKGYTKKKEKPILTKTRKKKNKTGK